MGVLTGCIPRPDVLVSDLNDNIFAAEFGDLLIGKAAEVYASPRPFFDNTYPTAPLRKIVQMVFERLADPKQNGASLRLSTGFGGGKTHTLMALWHLGNNIGDATLGTDLLPAAGRPKSVRVVAIDAGKAGIPIFSSHGRVQVKSLWGEMFYQLGGQKALKALGDVDDPEASPHADALDDVAPADPLLILLDELVIYMDKLSARGQGNLLGFVNNLISFAGNRPRTFLIVTDPGKQQAYSQATAQLQQAGARLDDVLSRKISDYDPIGNESARVINRRLFESVDHHAAEQASSTYLDLYQRVADDPGCPLPKEAATTNYAKRIVECYPFHPRLIETVQDRLGALQDFQQSRGVLRLFARMLRDVWERHDDIELITAGEVNWESERIQADLIRRLNRDNFMAAIHADVQRHAMELDGGARCVHCRAASALLLESLPLSGNSGLDAAQVTLAVLRPDEAGNEPAEALDRLVGSCWHTYPMEGGRGHQFRYEPNVIKQIEERMADISPEDAKSRVLAEAQGYFSGPSFKLVAWPNSPQQVSTSAELQLALCEQEDVARRVVAYEDDSNPGAPMPRGFRNAILAVTASSAAFAAAVTDARRLLAMEAIDRESKKGPGSSLVQEQLKPIRPQYTKRFRVQTCRAFDRIVLAPTKGKTVEPRNCQAYSLGEQFQVSEDQIMQKAEGQPCLRRFLEAKQFVYKAGDALAPTLLVTLLSGTTPVSGQKDVYTAKALHERFLGAPELRLFPDGSIVRGTLLKAVEEGVVVVRQDSGTGDAYHRSGHVTGVMGQRRKVAGGLTGTKLDDTVWLTAADSDAAKEWLKEDPKPKPGDAGSGTGTGIGEGQGGWNATAPPPPSQKTVQAFTWEKVRELASQRPLQALDLVAAKPADAQTLIALAQPFGADSLHLSVSVSGVVKDGGDINYSASKVKPNNPTKPLAMAQTIFNALTEGASFEAVLGLTFNGEGRMLTAQLSDLCDKASANVTPRATFGKATS